MQIFCLQLLQCSLGMFSFLEILSFCHSAWLLSTNLSSRLCQSVLLLPVVCFSLQLLYSSAVILFYISLVNWPLNLSIFSPSPSKGIWSSKDKISEIHYIFMTVTLNSVSGKVLFSDVLCNSFGWTYSSGSLCLRLALSPVLESSFM